MIDIKYNIENIKRLIPLISEYAAASEDLRIIAMDLKRSVANCSLSMKQVKIISLMITGHYKQSEVADIMHLSKSSVNAEYKKACEKICIYLNENC